jgi:drug/metabolite transporter superfamily protein YnfA
MIERFRVQKTVLRLAVGAFVLAIAAWGLVTLVATTAPGISLAAGGLVLGCAVVWLLIQRSRAAHDRAIADTYPSFAPALARRRAEGSIDI